MSILLPEWLQHVPLHRQDRARTRFLLRAAALYASEAGQLRTLSIICGFHPHTLATTAGSREFMSAELARAIEENVGRQLFPREVLNPRVFDPARSCLIDQP